MTKGTRICKVCGAEYEYCHTQAPRSGTKRWQDVACGPEHAAIYFARVLAARSGASAEDEVTEDVSVAQIVENEDTAEEQDEDVVIEGEDDDAAPWDDDEDEYE